MSWRGEGDLLDVVLLRAIAQEIAAMPDRCPVVIDMSAVTTMDSITLGQLLGLLRRLRAAGRQLRLAGVQPGVQRGFDLMGLRRALSFDPDVTSSLAAIPGIVTAT